MLRIFFPASFVLFCLVPCFDGQESLFERNKEVAVPEAVMREVVGRILKYHFKSGMRKRNIPISDRSGINTKWFPSINNITFHLVREEQVRDHRKGVFIFDKIERQGNVYVVYVGWGDLDCNRDGITWKFAVGETGKVRLWPSLGWGRRCYRSGPSVIRGLKLGDISPNELRGYEFFRKGKLKEIRLGLSTRTDMERLFGSTCEAPCDYDQNWSVWVNYFDSENTGTISTSDGKGNSIETELVPKPEVDGRLAFVRMSPKKPISFKRIFFSDIFFKNQLYSIGDSFGSDGFVGAVHSEVETFTDGYGLSYHLYVRETFNNLPAKERAKEAGLRSRDLVQIVYEIPDALNDVIFIRRVKSSKK